MISVQPANRPDMTPVSADASPPVGGPADGGAPLLLPEPSASGLSDDAMTQLAVLITQADQQDRRAAQGLQQTADQAATQAANQQVQAIRDKANAEGSSAAWSGVGDIISGACTALGAMGGDGSGAAVGDSKGAICPARPDRAFNYAALFDSLSKGTSGIVKFETGALAAEGDYLDADAMKHKALSEADVRRYDQAHGDVQAADQSIQKVQQFLQNVVEAENAARLAAASDRV